MKIQRLNMDNSWFIELSNGVRFLIDPWLEGSEVDFAKWFNEQWHRTPPLSYDQLPTYDYVLITQKYPDHFHTETLKKLNPKVIIGPMSINKRVKKNLPNSKFIGLNKSSKSYGANGFQLTFLPTSRKIDPIYDGFVLTENNQSILLATHGIALPFNSDVSAFGNFKLLIHPFNRYKLPTVLGGTVAPGMNALKALTNLIQPDYIVATHDEDKHTKGIVSKFAKIDWAPEKSELLKLDWLQYKYLPLEDYQIIEL